MERIQYISFSYQTEITTESQFKTLKKKEKKERVVNFLESY